MALERNGRLSQDHKVLIRKFLLLNKMNLWVGFLVMALVLSVSDSLSVRMTLLTIGLYFLLQVLPVIISRRMLDDASPGRNVDRADATIFGFVSPSAIGIAVLLFLAFLIKSLIDWDGGFGPQLLKMAVFVGVNGYLAYTLISLLGKMGKSSGEERLKLIYFLSKASPLFVYLSIGISLYYFGKMLIFNYGMEGLRPIMMSIALTMVGTAMFAILKPLEASEGDD
ncbi:hypothetical protein [Flagellimonas lutimaris]|nr:hypothetical protein [Allomuricauda lutimaris]